MVRIWRALIARLRTNCSKHSPTGAPEIFEFPGASMPLIDDFAAQAQASLYPKALPRQRTKRPAPFSLRLSDDERARLLEEAKGAPLGAYIKAKVLGSAPPPNLRRSGLSIEDRKAFAQALALLGQSRLCRYKSGLPLPDIKKKVIYLDQFFFSHAFRGNDERFMAAAELIRDLANKQLIVAPYSSIHEEETHQWERFAELMEFIKAASRGHEFEPAYDVERVQVANGFDALLKEGP